MPYNPADRRLPHLALIREEPTGERRRNTGGGATPSLGRDRRDAGNQLLQAAERVLQEQRAQPAPPPGIQPHLVLKLPLARGARIDLLTDVLRRAGLTVVSVEQDGAVIAFRDQVDLQDFRSAVQQYQQGPRQGINPHTQQPYASTAFDILEYIDAQGMHAWRVEDRIGLRLAQEIGVSGERIMPERLYSLDIEIWYPGNKRDALRELQQIEQFLNRQNNECRLTDRYIGDSIAISRVIVNGLALRELLLFPIILEIEYPPIPGFDPISAGNITFRDFLPPPPPIEDGPRVCIIDSGITANHPLLAPYVGHEIAVLSCEASPSDAHGHGTMVGAIAVFGDIRKCYEERQFVSNITLYSARILNEQNEFDVVGIDRERLIINQIRDAITIFASPPYRCRVFNMSIGGSQNYLGGDIRRQSAYAEAIDKIARDMQVLIVISAGNNREFPTNRDELANEMQVYPEQLIRPSARLNDFATSAISLTVGALAQYDQISIPRQHMANDIVRLIAEVDEPSPITRAGPGIQDSFNPEFVHYGGSYVFDRGIGLKIDPGTAVMSFSHQPIERLFAFNVGTSFAAPRVARQAALIEYQLRQETGDESHPNLIRALLALSARVPDPARRLLERLPEQRCVEKVCGYGLPDEDFALFSSDQRVTMYAQSSIRLDHFHIYSLPIPDAFRFVSGERTITIALAFDPPVKARRIDYLGVEMDISLIRGITLTDLYDHLRRLGDDEDMDQAIPSRYRMRLEPGPRGSVGQPKRKKSTLQCARTILRRPDRPQYDYGDVYWLVVRAERKWAPQEIQQQSYAVAVTLEANAPELYNQVRQRIQQRLQQRGRVQV